MVPGDVAQEDRPAGGCIVQAGHADGARRAMNVRLQHPACMLVQPDASEHSLLAAADAKRRGMRRGGHCQPQLGPQSLHVQLPLHSPQGRAR